MAGPGVLLIALVVAVFALGALGLLCRAFVRRQASLPGDEADSNATVCGACRYSLRGISTLNCPECGADLREVGMLPPKHRARSFRSGIVAVFLLLMAIAGVLVYVLVAATVLPHNISSFKTDFFQGPKSGAYVDVETQSVIYSRVIPIASRGKKGWPVRTLLLWHTHDLTTWQVEIDHEPQAWRLIFPRDVEASGTDFDLADLDALFVKSGIDTDDQQIQVELNTIVGHLNKLRAAQLLQPGPWGEKSSSYNSAGGSGSPGFTSGVEQRITYTSPSEEVRALFGLAWLVLTVATAIRVSRALGFGRPKTE